jgi:hypothetical protein
MRFFEDTGDMSGMSGTDPSDVPGGDLTGTEGQFDEPAGGGADS